MRPVRRGALAGFLFGVAVAVFCGIWYARERGMGQDAPFLFAAVLSVPLSQVIGAYWPASGTAQWAPWFVALIPPVNGMVVGALAGAVASLARRWQSS